MASKNSVAFRSASYKSYLVLVNHVRGLVSIADTVEALSPVFADYGNVPALSEHDVVLLTTKLTRICKVDGQQVVKVLSITSFRQLIKNGLMSELRELDVVYNAGKEPNEPAKKSAKKSVKAQLEEQTVMAQKLMDFIAAHGLTFEEVA